MLVTGLPTGRTATVRAPGSARQSGTVDGANEKNMARKALPNPCRNAAIPLNTCLLPVSTEDILHRIDNLAERGTNPCRFDY